MRYLILTIAAVLLVGCGEALQSVPAPEAETEPPISIVPIHDAIGEGDIEAVKQYLADGEGVDVRDGIRANSTPLYWARTNAPYRVEVVLCQLS